MPNSNLSSPPSDEQQQTQLGAAELAIELILSIVARRYGHYAANSIRKAFVTETLAAVQQELAVRRSGNNFVNQ